MSPKAATAPEPEVESPEKRQLRLTRIKALIQQASSQEGDGQQAAWRACALIRKFGLDIVDPELVDGLYKEIHTLKAELESAKAGDPDAGFNPIGGFNPSAGGGIYTSQHSGHFWTSSAQQWPTQPSAPPTPPPQPAGPGGSPMTAPAFIAQSKFAGRCKHCRKVIDIGDPVQWLKSVGVWCGTTSCYADWLNNQKAAGVFNPFGVP